MNLNEIVLHNIIIGIYFFHTLIFVLYLSARRLLAGNGVIQNNHVKHDELTSLKKLPDDGQ